MDFGQTTAPGRGSTAEDPREERWLHLVLAKSTAEPERVGESAPCPPGQRLFVGRGDREIEKFARFDPWRPGTMASADPRKAILGGGALSRRQFSVLSRGDFLEVEQLGQCVTYFNGQERTKGILRPGDTLRLKGEVVLLCVSRPRVLRLPHLRSGIPILGEPDAHGIIGGSEAAYRMRAQLEAAARGRRHVLILGESGTGKELAAQAIHQLSSRSDGPLVSRNASTFTSTLLASELFGNPAGYPNPGMPSRKGLIGAAHGGTLYFDEIGDIPLEAQAQLLRVMDQGEYQQQGDTVVRRVDVRFVGATNRDVTDETLFRADFLARFFVRVQLPPLRERPEDIPLLVRHFLLERAREDSDFRERFCRQGSDGRIEPKVSGRLIDELVRHPLPVNARQLQTLLEAAVRASEEGEGNELRPPKGGWKTTAAPAQPTGQSAPPSAGSLSREELVAWLKAEEGNVARISRRTGIERTKITRLITAYKLVISDYKIKRK